MPACASPKWWHYIHHGTLSVLSLGLIWSHLGIIAESTPLTACCMYVPCKYHQKTRAATCECQVPFTLFGDLSCVRAGAATTACFTLVCMYICILHKCQNPVFVFLVFSSTAVTANNAAVVAVCVGSRYLQLRMIYGGPDIFFDIIRTTLRASNTTGQAGN